MADIKLAGLLSARLCHDLVGPVGAIANGIEFLEDADDEMRDQALGLIGRSASQLSERLQFYRYAFGASTGPGAEAQIGHTRDIAIAVMRQEKVALDWPRTALESGLDRDRVKLILNLISVAAHGLPRGGEVKVRLAPAGEGVRIEIVAAGEGGALKPSTRAALAGEVSLDELDARGVQPYFAALQARDIGAALEITTPAVDQFVIVTSVGPAV